MSSSNPDFWRNPQYRLRVRVRSDLIGKQQYIHVFLGQKMRAVGDKKSGAVETPHAIGAYVFNQPAVREMYCNAAFRGARTSVPAALCVGPDFKFSSSAEVRRSVSLDSVPVPPDTDHVDVYLVPCTYEPNHFGDFLLSVVSNMPIELSAQDAVKHTPVLAKPGICADGQ